MVSARPLISHLFGLFRPPEVSAPIARRFESPVNKVSRLPRFVDGFDGTRNAPLQSQVAKKWTAPDFHRDGFEAAARKPMNLSGRVDAPAVRAAPWLKENDAKLPKADFVASLNDF